MNKPLQICLIEPYYGGSHQQWVDGLRHFSMHQYHLLSLPARHWKWRMYGAAVSLAKEYEKIGVDFDLILASDMLDLATFLGLLRRKSAIPKVAVYFHENQLTYPWSPTDDDVAKNRDRHYAWTNYISALAADRVFFNSNFHKESFLLALPSFLGAFPDHKCMENVSLIASKSEVLPLGLDLQKFDALQLKGARDGTPLILWNHRWEYDKRPDLFFGCCRRLKEEGYSFKLVILGQRYRIAPTIFAQAREEFADHIMEWGYVESAEIYGEWLHRSDILLVTGEQDFFGGSCVEAMYCNTYPILPNRLAYPEHLGPQQREQHLYNNEEEMYEKLTWAIENINFVRNIKYRDQFARYDWRVLRKMYDQRLSDVSVHA